MASRRQFLKILGGGTIVAAGASAGFLATRTPHAALAPWNVGTYADPRKQALAFAVLAPNPHNRQPWLVEMVGEDSFYIHRDLDRDLPETDPFHRQLYIGLGCFTEATVLAAGAAGYDAQVTPFPDGDDGPVALVKFVEGGQKDPLADQLALRHSDKGPYEARTLSDVHMDDLAGFADVYSDPAVVAEIRDMTKRAFEIEVMTPHTFKESVDLMRIGKAEINANPDGIEMREASFEVLRRIGAMSDATISNPNHFGFQGFLAGYLDMLDQTQHYAVITTAGNTRMDQVEAGRRFMRLGLKTTEIGVGLHPVSQALQEYVEMSEEYQLAHSLMAPEGHTVQMLSRLGYGSSAIATPRWGLETRIVS
ncbi:MAG: twin-arginine translocation pathway signal protein [Pseudomonadota bacterium]